MNDSLDWSNTSSKEEHKWPLPTISALGKKELTEELQRIEYLQSQGTTQKIALLLAKLRGRYWQPDLPANLLKELVKDDMVYVKDYPFDLIEKAVLYWQNDPAHEFAPKSMAQLMESVRIEWTERKKRKFRILKLLD